MKRPRAKSTTSAAVMRIVSITVNPDKHLLLKQASIFLPEEKLRTLKDILARAKTFEEAAEEFRR
ncbi:MAG: hypothetical protein ACE5KU_00675 [Nitrososphaerales archaeon]